MCVADMVVKRVLQIYPVTVCGSGSMDNIREGSALAGCIFQVQCKAATLAANRYH